ncbi:urease accessory protein UreD [Faunimonas sp. B44]|uniref:urease accessory protein UreD n=1 Tax=Faunimonas sp. B44 TaxID=3461493 RepID=UPI004043EA62
MLKVLDPAPAAASGTRARQRSLGRVDLSVSRQGGATRVARLSEAGASRLRLPRAVADPLEAVIINTGGGMACGDRYSVSIDAGARSDVVVTTPAAERVYRSDGAEAVLDVRLAAACGACLAWLPQETILYDRARLRRRFDAELAADAALLVFEALVLGRAASGESMKEGAVEDRWRIRRDGRLVYADTLRLDGDIAALSKRPAVLGGAAALATLLYVAPDAEARLDEARDALSGSRSTAGASAWNGMLAVRILASSVADLRHDGMRLIEALTSRPLPRVWRS